MICFHKGVGRLPNPLREVVNNTTTPFEAYDCIFREHRKGIYISDHKTKFKNAFRVTLKYPDIVVVENSMHKYLEGGFNVFDITHQEMIAGFKDVYQSIGLPIDGVKIYRGGKSYNNMQQHSLSKKRTICRNGLCRQDLWKIPSNGQL